MARAFEHDLDSLPPLARGVHLRPSTDNGTEYGSDSGPEVSYHIRLLLAA